MVILGFDQTSSFGSALTRVSQRRLVSFLERVMCQGAEREREEGKGADGTGMLDDQVMHKEKGNGQKKTYFSSLFQE